MFNNQQLQPGQHPLQGQQAQQSQYQGYQPQQGQQQAPQGQQGGAGEYGAANAGAPYPGYGSSGAAGAAGSAAPYSQYAMYQQQQQQQQQQPQGGSQLAAGVPHGQQYGLAHASGVLAYGGAAGGASSVGGAGSNTLASNSTGAVGAPSLLATLAAAGGASALGKGSVSSEYTAGAAGGNVNNSLVGQYQPPGIRPRVTTTMWEDEKTLCYQVDANNVSVVRRADNNMINGTKLLNVAQMTRGRRDGILKSEKMRHVVKIGSMHLKGVWIPFERALAMAQREGIVDLLYPLFVRDIKRVIQTGVTPTTLGAAALSAVVAAGSGASGASVPPMSKTPVASSSYPAGAGASAAGLAAGLAANPGMSYYQQYPSQYPPASEAANGSALPQLQAQLLQQAQIYGYSQPSYYNQYYAYNQQGALGALGAAGAAGAASGGSGSANYASYSQAPVYLSYGGYSQQGLAQPQQALLKAYELPLQPAANQLSLQTSPSLKKEEKK